ncbi:MAG TPA: thioredoxin family protein [Flavipsychrobacter sp.]|nr:thioredoxin family protein [Flavipsychrobacter sp.]
MKKIVFLLAMAGISATMYAQDLVQLEHGSEMPGGEIRLSSVTGEEISLSEAKKEGGLLVMFSCNTCPYVLKSQARTKEMVDYAGQNNIGVVIVNSNEAQRDKADSYEAMKKYAKDQKYKVPYVVDENSKLADLFGATRTPEVFLYNREGKLMYHGAMEDNPSSPAESKEFYLKNAMDKIVTGEMPDVNFTKSIGCTIKRKS